MNLNDLSNDIYILNLKSRSDRRQHILSQFEKINCTKYTLFDALDGSLFKNNTRLKNGMLGLVLTYVEIYKNWVKNKSDNILIVEDDCIFNEDFSAKLSVYISHVPKNWEMLYFGANHNYHMGEKTEAINDYCIKLNNSFSAHCVLLKSFVFEELISIISGLSIENDVALANLQKKYNAYSSSSPLTSQIESFSDIEKCVVDYDWLIK
jgi:GR25 family glycosyltransferase involved in LPS biosynthesis